MSTTRLPHDWFPEPVPDNVSIGKGSWLYSSFAFRHYQSRRAMGVQIGRHTGIYDGVFFDLGPNGEVSIGDYCTIVGAILCTNRRIEIHDYAFVAHEVLMADDEAAAPPGAVTPSRAASGQDSAILLERDTWIGARAVLLGGAHIGEGAIVGAAAVVDFAVPPYSIVAGNPAQVVGRVPTRS